MDAHADKTQDDKRDKDSLISNPVKTTGLKGNWKIVQSATAVTKTPDVTTHIQNLSYDDHT